MTDSRDNPGRRDREAVVLYLFSAALCVGVFVMATMVAPWLFDLQNTLAVAAAVAIWIACPVVIFLGVRRLQRRLRTPAAEPPKGNSSP